MEISRFPHSEIACSNILAFFFDPNEEHGLGDLLLKSLLAAAGKPAVNECRSIRVERELATEERKRLDIVLVAEREMVAGIENKLGHSAEGNPYADYSQELERLAGENAVPNNRIVKILLSLKSEDPAGKSGFAPLTYRQLFESVEANLGSKVANADPRYLGYLIDFMTTINGLEKGTRMNEETVNFFLQHGRTAVELYYSTAELIEELDEKMNQAFKALGDLPPQVKVKLTKFEWELNKKEPSRRADALYSSRWCEVAVEQDLTLGIETNLWLRDGNNAWEICVWSSEAGQERVNKWLEANGITPDESRGGRLARMDGFMPATNTRNPRK